MTETEFQKKYQQYAQDLYQICYGYTHNVQTAEDILQDVFLTYLKNQPHFKDALHEKYWLIRITINQCKNHVTSTYHKRVSLKEEMIEAFPDQILSKEKEVLIRIIKHLPNKYREIIILYYYNSYSTSDLSTLLHISISAVKKRLERARNMIKEEMEDYYES